MPLHKVSKFFTMKKTNFQLFFFIAFSAILSLNSCTAPCSSDPSLNMAIKYVDAKGTNLFDKTNGFHKDSIDVFYIDEKGVEVKYFDASKDWQESYQIYKNENKENVFNFVAVGPSLSRKMTNIIYFKNKKDRDTLVCTLDKKCENIIEEITYNGNKVSINDGNRAFSIAKNY
jgi:fructose-1,6-bisphosphatase/sedoheptulose 1,7-bisphosphatase-like protein